MSCSRENYPQGTVNNFSGKALNLLRRTKEKANYWHSITEFVDARDLPA